MVPEKQINTQTTEDLNDKFDENEIAAITPNMGIQIQPTAWCKPNLILVLLVLQKVVNCLIQGPTFLCMSILVQLKDGLTQILT